LSRKDSLGPNSKSDGRGQAFEGQRVIPPVIDLGHNARDCTW
jgi:hypothetical protein